MTPVSSSVANSAGFPGVSSMNSSGSSWPSTSTPVIPPLPSSLTVTRRSLTGHVYAVAHGLSRHRRSSCPSACRYFVRERPPQTRLLPRPPTEEDTLTQTQQFVTSVAALSLSTRRLRWGLGFARCTSQAAR